MENIKIYSQGGELLLDIPVDDSSNRYKEVMGDNKLELLYSLNEFVEIPMFAWCEFKAEQYLLFTPENFVQQHTEHWDYTLTLEAWIAYLRYVKFKFFTVERNPGETDKMVGTPKLKFSLTATPRDFAQLLVDVMNFSGVAGWTVGECIDSVPVTIDFNHDWCYSVLQKVADAFDTEWEVDNKTIHFRKVERRDEEGNRISFPLSYGYNNGILPGIARTQYDDSKIINRINIQGGDQNINRKTYGNDTLLMPKNMVFEYEGIQFRTDETGTYVEPADPTGALSEDSLDTSKIYPRRVGEVSTAIEVDDAQGFYDFTDESIPEALDFSKMIIPGETMTVVFQDGVLAGKEFDAKYSHATRKFILAPINSNGLIYPQGSLIPEVGNKYAVFHITLPQEYIDSAEIETRDEAVRALYEGMFPKYTYDIRLHEKYAKENWGAIGGYLAPGYFVRFSSPQFQPDPIDIRIVSVHEYVNRPKTATIQVANNVTGKSLSLVLNEIPTQEQATDNKVATVREYARRRWRDAQELIDGIVGMSDEFKESLLSSLVFEGMILRLGAESLQYRYVANDWDTSIEPDIYFNKANKKLYCPLSRIKHETIEIDGQKPYWIAPAFNTDALTDTGTPYYLYLQASKELSVVDGRLTGEATYYISTEKIKIDDVDGYYTFWVAFVNSQNEESDRVLSFMYGVLTLLPGQGIFDTLLSADGKNYWKALKNQFKMGGLDWNVTKQGALTIRDADIVIINETTGAIIASISGSTGAATFAKGNARFNADGSVELSSENPNDNSTIGISAGGLYLKDHTGAKTLNIYNYQGLPIINLNEGANSKRGVTLLPGRMTVFYHPGSSNPLVSQISIENGVLVVRDNAGAILFSANGQNNSIGLNNATANRLTANGITLGTKMITATTETWTNADAETSLVVSTSNVRQNAVLPSTADRGREIKFRAFGSGQIRVYPPAGHLLYNDTSADDYIDLPAGNLGTCLYIGELIIGSSSKSVWVFNKMGW